MLTMPLVSIVMPVYNSDRYLELSINSVLNQTYRNIELICVDDGSTDSSVEIVKKIQSTDHRVKLMQQKNQYAGVARNNGLKQASGKYVMFLDSDDVFGKKMVSSLVKYAEANKADVVIFGYYKFSNKLSRKRPCRMPYVNKNIVNPIEISDKIFQVSFGVPWNKFINRELILSTGLEFQNLRNNNDEFFSKMIVLEAERLLYINDKFVNYRINNSHSLQGSLNKEPTNFAKALMAMYQYMEKVGKYEIYKKSFYKFVFNLSYEALFRANTYDIFMKVFGAIYEMIDSLNWTDLQESLNSDELQIFHKIKNRDIASLIFDLLQNRKKESVPNTSIEYRIGHRIINAIGFK